MYASLLNYWNEQGRNGPIRVFSHQMIGLAKLSCRDTYFKYVGELSEYGLSGMSVPSTATDLVKYTCTL